MAIDRIRNDPFENIVSDQDQRPIVRKTLELLENGCPVLPDDIAILACVSPEKVLSTVHSFGRRLTKSEICNT